MRRRAMVLLAVLLVVTMSALIGTTLIVSVAAERVLIEGGLRRGESRAMAISGVRAAMYELASQRDALIGGEAPDLTEAWTGAELGGESLVVRMIPFEDGALSRSEAALVDVNRAPEAVLRALGVLDDDAVDALVSGRAGAFFSSVDEFARDRRLARSLDPTVDSGRVRGGGDDPAAFGADDAGGVAARPGDVLTVFAFDPEVTSGVGEIESGLTRVVVNQPWTERLQEDLETVLGAEMARAIGGSMLIGDSPTSMPELITTIAGESASAGVLGTVIDGVAFGADPFGLGRIDINRAGRPVLAALAAVSDSLDGEAFADALISARERLGAEQLRNPAWPVESGDLTRDQFAVLAPFITTRSLVWRVRVEAGFQTVGDGPELMTLPQSDEFGVAIEEEPQGSALRHRVVFEAVIDVSAARPRLAYLRDVTSLEIMQAQRVAALTAEAEAGPRRLVRSEPSGLDEPADEADRDFMTRATPEALRRGRDQWQPGAMAEAASRDRDEGMSPPGGRRAPSRDEGGSAAGPAAGVDRRLGRWTAGEPSGMGDR